MRLLPSVAVLVLVGCVRAPPPPAPPPPRPPPPPAVSIPEGCAADTSGRFVLASDPRYRYELRDDLDAGRVEAIVVRDEASDAGPAPRRFTRDGGLPWLVKRADTGDASDRPSAPDAGQAPLAVITFERTARGFHGRSAPPDGGCGFPARIIECRPEGLVVRTAARRSADCTTLEDAGLRDFMLLRPDAGWSDAGLDTPRQATDGGVDGGAHSTPDR